MKLNRVRKNLIILMLIACLAKPALAANDSTISYVSINDKVYYDIELMITDKAEILVPFKQLADLFEVKYVANRVDKHIQFKTYDGQDGVINQNGVFINDKTIQKRAPIFLIQGIMDNVFNEAFIQASTAEMIFGTKLDTDYSTITISANTSRDIQALKADGDYADNNGPKAYKDIVIPKPNRTISLNRIGVRSNMINTDMKTKWQHYSTTSDHYSGSTQVSLGGEAFGGKYRVESTAYHYDSNSFLFGGVSATYLNNFINKKDGKRYFYELGKVRGRTDIDAKIGTNIFGAQIWNYDYQKTPVNKLNGYVKPTSLVRVTINDNEPVTLNTYAGYYSLSEMKISGAVEKVKIEEINEDGTVEVIKEERYSLYGDDRPFEKEGRGLAYAGVWGYQNRLFRDGSDIYYGNNKKVTAGGYYQYGVKDNVTFETKLAADKIYEKTSSKVMHHIPTNDALLVTGTQKNVNYQEGITSLNSIDYVSKKDPNLKLRGTAGASVAHDIRERDTHAGYMVKGTADYSKNLSKYAWKFIKPKMATVRTEAFHSSPDWYIASSDSTSKNDRTGGRAQGALSFNSTSVSGGYNKYYSNINHRYEGGTINFDEYNIAASSRIPKVGIARFNMFHRRGSNDLGRNKNYNYDAIHEILEDNTFENFSNGEMGEIGNILLTGVTGFLGIHILYEFIKNEEGKIYCMLRKGKFDSCEERLIDVMNYYFDEDLTDLIGSRIIIIEGDITEIEDFKKLEDVPIDTIINSAALVKHYTADDYIFKVNVDGVINGLKFAQTRNNIKYVQISTISVLSSYSLNEEAYPNQEYNERTLYYEQDLENKYVCSKFLAERAVLQAATKGLSVKIIRVGNLMSRYSDGLFQKNYDTNAFLNNIKTIKKLGAMNPAMANETVDMSQIDYVAKGILALCKTPDKSRVFHCMNNHYISHRDIVDALNTYGYGIAEVDFEEFKQIYEHNINENIQGIITADFSIDDFDEEHGLKPCAFLTVWNVRHEWDGKDYLDMTMVQRSSDFATAGCINQVQYAELLLMVAKEVGMKAGKFTAA